MEKDAEKQEKLKKLALLNSDPFQRTDIKQYDYNGMVGQRRIVSAENALSEQGGFYCEACDYLMKDHKVDYFSFLSFFLLTFFAVLPGAL